MEPTLSMREHAVKVELKCEDSETSPDCVIPKVASTQWVAEELCKRDVKEYAGYFAAHCTKELKTEEIDLGCDYIESTLNMDPPLQKVEPQNSAESERLDLNSRIDCVKTDNCSQRCVHPNVRSTYTDNESQMTKAVTEDETDNFVNVKEEWCDSDEATPINHISTQDKRHKCSICDKTFARKDSVSKHLLTHTRDKSHTCKICKMVFNFRIHLNSHMLMHTGVNTHKCTICEKQFVERDSLKKHMLTHGEKLLKCEFCEKRFAYKAYLNKHLVMHTGERPHACNMCDMKFTQKCYLSKHILTHTGEKPHKCTVCGKRFTTKGTLNQHMSTHTGDKPHKCHVCERKFAHKNALKNHMLKHVQEYSNKCAT